MDVMGSRSTTTFAWFGDGIADSLSSRKVPAFCISSPHYLSGTRRGSFGKPPKGACSFAAEDGGAP